MAIIKWRGSWFSFSVAWPFIILVIGIVLAFVASLWGR